MYLTEYETIVILRPDLGDDAMEKVLDRLRGIVTSKGGTFLVDRSWGKRKLAYEVKKHLKGTYHYFRYAGDGELVKQLERTCKMIETIIKYMTVKLDENINLDQKLEEIKKEEEAFLARKAEEEQSKATNDQNDSNANENGEASQENTESVKSEDENSTREIAADSENEAEASEEKPDNDEQTETESNETVDDDTADKDNEETK